MADGKEAHPAGVERKKDIKKKNDGGYEGSSGSY